MRFKLFIFLFVTFVYHVASAQSQRELGQLMRERGEYYFTLTIQQKPEIQEINKLCSVDGFDGKDVVCYANQKQYDHLLQAGYKPTLQTPPSLREEARMWDGNRATYEWDSYPTYDQYVSMMEGFTVIKRDNRVITLLDLGTLSSGRKILGIRINNGNTEGKPKFLYSSTIHGDETTGMILMLRLIDELCSSKDTRIVNLVNNLDIFIFPDANPDGTYYGGNSTVTGSRRANANGVDMNRNYADPHSSAHPDGNDYQTETQWFMQLAEDYPFVMAANFHGGAEVMNYPWDNTSTRHADDAWWQYISNEYVANTRAVYPSYMTDTYSSGITNGADWYTIGGGRQDYMNGYRQCREITIECSTDKTLAASQLNNYWNYNHVAMLAFMEQCLNGIHGVVKDANTQDLIDGATITVKNHDDEYSIVSTHEDGYFHRPIKGGTWTLEISKAGYHTETVQVTVADDQRQDIEVFLTPYGADEKDCYEQTMPSAAGEYVMGYLNGSTLVMPSHNNSSTVTTTSLDVTATDNGFSVNPGTTIPKITLTAYQSNQYYISYNGRYLARSNYGNSLTWGTSQSSYGRWYINSNGIYVTRNNTNYYLYYSNGSFQLSDTQQNNISFYVAGDCPIVNYTITATASPEEGGSVSGAGTFNQGETCMLTATANVGYTFINWTEDGEVVSTESIYEFTVTADRNLVANFEETISMFPQTFLFNIDWNWWAPNVDINLDDLQNALGNYCLSIVAQDGKSADHDSELGWGGDLNSIELGKMYKVQTTEACTITVAGTIVDPSDYPITLYPGANWIGIIGSEEMTIEQAFAGLSPTHLDNIKTSNGSATYYNNRGWKGNVSTLKPGEGFIYKSKATGEKTFYYPSMK